MHRQTIMAASLSVMALIALAGHARAQTTNDDPTSGILSLDPAQGPQRFDMSITAGGDIDADDLGRDCAGDISDAPSLRLRYGSGGDTLRIIATSNTDTSLVIQTPAGDWLCNDDAMGGLDPIISLSSPAAGDYAIWVGRVSSFWGSGDAEPVELTLLDINGDADTRRYLPTPGTLELSAGFQPSEIGVHVHANGAVRPRAWDNRCGAAASETSALNLSYDGTGAGLDIRAEAQDDVTLLVRTPDGRFVCNDDLESVDFVSIPNAGAGQYVIWVGPQTDEARRSLVPVRLILSEF